MEKTRVLVQVSATGRDKTEGGGELKRRLARDAGRLKAIGRLAAEGWFRSSLVWSRSTGARLYLDNWMRGAAGAQVGDRVRVRLKRDSNSRELPVPESFRRALERNARVAAAWELLAPSRRREILTYLNFLKTPAALQRNVEKTLAKLSGEEDLDPG